MPTSKFLFHLFLVVPDFNWRDNFKADTVYKVCYICHQKFLGLHQLTKHLRSHNQIDFNCLVCHKKLSSGFLLHEHMRCHYNEKEVTNTNESWNKTNNSCYQCQFCPQLKVTFFQEIVVSEKDRTQKVIFTIFFTDF